MRKEGLVIIYHGGGGEGGIRRIFIMSRQDLPDDPPIRICNILMIPPTPLPLMDAILVSCTKAPFIKSGFAANVPLPSPGYTSKLVSELIIMVEMVFMKMQVIFN